MGRIREIHQILYTIIHIFLSPNNPIVSKLAGRYQIIRELSGGTFAVTYLAQDDMQPSKPFCVVKQLRPIYTDAQVLGLFEKEAVILEKLGKHPPGLCSPLYSCPSALCALDSLHFPMVTEWSDQKYFSRFWE